MANSPTILRAQYDVIIVGSGHNGLVAAAYLARAGKSVLVLEKSPTLGGATTSQRIFPDYDAWISRYAYLISLFPQKIVDDLGLAFETRRRSVASFTPYRTKLGTESGLLLSNEDPQRSRDSLQRLTGNDREWQGLQHLWALERALAELAWPSLLEPMRSKEDFRRRISSPLQQEAWTSLVERPLGEVLERVLHHDLVRGLAFTDGKIGVFTDAHDSRLLQNRCFLYHVIGGGTGEWRVPVGGMRSLIDALLSIGRKSGAQYEVDAVVTRIDAEPEGCTVQVATAGGDRTVAARDVLVNAGPRTFARLLGDEWNPQDGDEGSVIKMNMLLRRLPKLRAQDVGNREAFCGSLHLAEGYQQMQTAHAIARDGKLPDPIPCEIYCHSLTDDTILSPDLRHAGFQTLTLFALDMPYRLFEESHDLRRDWVREKLLDQLDELCSEPFRDCLARDRQGELCLEIKTPQDLQREVDLDLGNIFHNQLSWFFAEQANQVGEWGVESDYPHVYRAGSSALRGGAVSGIPGHNAAMCLLSRDRRS